MRSVSIASDGTALVAGNHGVGFELYRRLRRDKAFNKATDSWHFLDVNREWFSFGQYNQDWLLPTCSRKRNSKLTIVIWSRCWFLRIPSKLKFRHSSRNIASSRSLCKSLRLSRNLATCSADTTIKIWSPTPKAGEVGAVGVGSSDGVYKLDKVLTGHQRWVWDMAYSADSAYLVSGKSSLTSIRSGML